MAKNDYEHHQPPRKFDKKKKKKHFGLNEDSDVSRANRVNFKNYLRQLKEQELLSDDEDDDDE